MINQKTEYRIQGRGFIPGIKDWLEMDRAAGIEIPWITSKEEALNLLGKIRAKGTDGVEYRVVTREVTEWEVIA